MKEKIEKRRDIGMSSLLIKSNDFATICRHAFGWAVEHKDEDMVSKVVSYWTSHINDISLEEISVFAAQFDKITARTLTEASEEKGNDICLMKTILERDLAAGAKVTGEYLYIPEWEADVFAEFAVLALGYSCEHPVEAGDAVYRFWEDNACRIKKSLMLRAYDMLQRAELDEDKRRKACE